MRSIVVSGLLAVLFWVSPLFLHGQAPDAAGIYRVGNGVSAPAVLYQPEPEFSEQERKLRISRTCSLSLVVDTEGHVRDVRVVRSVAEGLATEHREIAEAMDTKIVAAVRQYRFRPAVFQGKPVPVAVMTEVNFTVF